MTFRFVFLAFVAVSVWAQSEAIVATVNGQKLTVRQFRELVSRADPATKELATKQPEEFLRQLGFLELVSLEAEKAKLDQMHPYKDRLADSRRQILFQAAVDEKTKWVTPSEEQLRSVFDGRRAGTVEARVKVIFISLMSQTRELEGSKVLASSGPEQATEKAALAVKRARAGEDFLTLAKELSDDPAAVEKNADFPEAVRATSANIPTNIREAILAAKQGDVVGPLAHETGFYIFRVDTIGAPQFAQVRDEIANELKSSAMKKWVEEMHSKVRVTIDAPALLVQ